MGARQRNSVEMQDATAVQRIRARFAQTGNPAHIPLLRGGTFQAELAPHGVYVDNLGTSPFLPWEVF
jgi:hypothetical protein